MDHHWLLWGGLGACLAVGIALLARARWLQSQTLKKCIVLSVVVHAALAVVAAFVGGSRPASWGTADEGRMTMEVVPVVEPAGEELAALEPAGAADPPPPPESAVPPADHVPLLPVVATASAASPGGGAFAADRAEAAPATEKAHESAVPRLYADRLGGRRAAAAAARGGSVETERAVQEALAWLAAAQAADGRWSAAAHGAGAKRSASGHHHDAGSKSDHGVTGLSLLAFLGAGHTHRDGAHAGSVDRGVRFLVERQRADGSLAGDAEFFAALYCHGIAAIALGEACAVSGDAALRPPLERAVRHTLSLQHPATGGWRYAAGDRGDTSQFGWQVMALATARQAGVGGLEEAEARAATFLQSVSSGRAGGLAAYRPGERPTAAMTAEALFCRLLLGMPAEHPAAQEALALLAAEPPDSARPNVYAWYYATLASFHAGGPQWEAWNARLVAALLPLQRRDAGGLTGSWDPDPVWGQHGGRVYSTALAALALEVYYRHTPLHEHRAREREAGHFASTTAGITLRR